MMLFIAFIHTNNLDIEKRGGGDGGWDVFFKNFHFFFLFCFKNPKRGKESGSRNGSIHISSKDIRS